MVYLVDCEGAEYLLQILDGECCQSQFQKLLVWSFGKEQWVRKCKTNNYLRPGNVGKELKDQVAVPIIRKYYYVRLSSHLFEQRIAFDRTYL